MWAGQLGETVVWRNLELGCLKKPGLFTTSPLTFESLCGAEEVAQFLRVLVAI